MEIRGGIACIPDALSQADCAELIALYEDPTQVQYAGQTVSGPADDVKRTTEIRLTNDNCDLSGLCEDFNENLDLYLSELVGNLDFNVATMYSPPTRYELVKVACYPRDEGHYQALHQEQAGTMESVYRYFVFLVYLNDVASGGETVFPLQDLRIAPTRGTMLIWPAGFPFLHQGLTPRSDDKYVVSTCLEVAIEERIEYFRAVMESLE